MTFIKTSQNIPSVKNVKIHFKVIDKFLTIPPSLEDSTKYHSNFATVRINPYVFIMFLKSGHVNVSGIKNFEDINTAIQVFNRHFSLNIHRDNITIDNSTASGEFNHSIILQKLRQIPSNLRVSIRPYCFPSALIRPPPNHKKGNSYIKKTNKEKTSENTVDIASIILFANGKYIIVGAKSEHQILTTFKKLSDMVRSII